MPPPPDRFPLGAAVTVAELERDPHPCLARLRAAEPVSYLPALGGWLVTRHDLAIRAMRDAERFTVDDPRFSTALVVGPSMLSLDGVAHARHRGPFVAPFRLAEVRERLAAGVARAADELAEQVAAALAQGPVELRRGFAGPLAVRAMAAALGFDTATVPAVLAWYDAIVAGVSGVSADRPVPASAHAAYAALGDALRQAIATGADTVLAAAASAAGGLAEDEVVANAAVLLFGGIETTEGMIANLLLHLLEAPHALAAVRAEPALAAAALEESLRLEPAAAVVDRYATADVELGGAAIDRGALVTISLAGANRDPAVFTEPDRFDLGRGDARRHVAFAHGPHVCLGMHLARIEARAGVRALLRRVPGLRLDEERPAAVRGLVFRKPAELVVRVG